MKGKPSQNLKLLLLLVPILGTVLISGCTNTTGPTFGNGVAILNWEPSLSSVESGDNLQLRLRIQNQGELTARSVSAAITGIDTNDWGISGSPTQAVNLAPPDRVQSTQGETREFLFDAEAPGIPKGTTQPFTPQVRVFYVYRTTASKLVTVVNDQELQRLQDQGKTLSSKDTVTSAGPLKVTINAGKFLKIKEQGYGFSRTFPITIDIQNVGGGVVSTQSTMSTNPDYKVVFSLTQPSRLGITCTPSGTFAANAITLWKGQSASVTCNVQILSSPLSSEDDNIIVTLDYSYYIDASTTVTVTGVSEGSNIPYS